MATPDPFVRPRRTSSRGRRRLLSFEVLDQRRVLASLAGHVFEDANQSLRQDAGEIGLAHRVVYLDINGDGSLSAAEPVRQSDALGRFEFDSLPPGDYVVRLYNGTSSQTQTTPFLPQNVGDLLPVVDPFSQGTASHTGLQGDPGPQDGAGGPGYTVAGSVITELDLRTQATRAIDVGARITDFHALGNDRVLAILEPDASDPTIPLASLVSFADGRVTPVSLSPPAGSEGFAQLALASGNAGLLLPHSASGLSVPLHSLRWDSDAENWVSHPLDVNVSADAQMLASSSGPLVLVAQSVGADTQVALWSTVTESVIGGSPTLLAGTRTLLAFDDASSLAVVRDADGDVQVLDAANGFATLHVLPTWKGPIALDGHRELLFGVSGTDSLGIFDIRQGRMHAELTLPPELGAAAGLALAGGGDRVLVRGSDAIAQVRLDNPDGQRVRLAAETSTTDAVFGMYVDGANSPPAFAALADLEIEEDQPLNLAAPGLLSGSTDPDDDQFIALPLTAPSHGTVLVRPDGSIFYQPEPDFHGTETFQIQASDGRDHSEAITLVIHVTSVDDPPRSLDLEIPKVPETLVGPAIIGSFHVREVDGDTYQIWVSDSRFAIEGSNVVLVAGAELDYETEPVIPLTINALNPENDLDLAFLVTEVRVEDMDDAPTDVLPHQATVPENTPGAVVADLTIVDVDAIAGYVISVDDADFVVDGNTLRLAEGVALDFEATPARSVALTVRNAEGETLLTRTIEVSVQDNNDAVSDILLSGQTLPELASGYAVGMVSVVDQDAGAKHTLTVDDDRFEINGNLLKLRNGVYVRRADQSEILIVITATELGVQTLGLSKQFVLTVQGNESPYHNVQSPTDVDDNGATTPMDALIIINNLNQEGPRPLMDPIPYETGTPRFYDVNGDGRITPLDALIIINLLNRGTPSAEPIVDGSATDDDESPVAAPTPGPMPISPYPIPLTGEGEDDEEDQNNGWSFL